MKENKFLKMILILISILLINQFLKYFLKKDCDFVKMVENEKKRTNSKYWLGISILTAPRLLFYLIKNLDQMIQFIYLLLWIF
jgi:hypothetical protein